MYHIVLYFTVIEKQFKRTKRHSLGIWQHFQAWGNNPLMDGEVNSVDGDWHYKETTQNRKGSSVSRVLRSIS